MGTGIVGGIPLSFRFGDGPWGLERDDENSRKEFVEHAPKDFFDFYSETKRKQETGSKERTVSYYTIKPDVLLPNFKDFFFEFNELIGVKTSSGMDGGKKFNAEYDAVVASGSLDKFIEFFDDNSGYEPTIFPYFDPMYITDSENLLVYQGSYKAMLEEWSSLLHMERLLWAAMKHPLAKVMRFGMSL
ncbi:MAG: hypothetical protein LBK97_06205 [Prevotellaceae bacterium]|jgi:hypothetical protein|nr:hypothetical protein [Prevotellaceae bacterium]